MKIPSFPAFLPCEQNSGSFLKSFSFQNILQHNSCFQPPKKPARFFPHLLADENIGSLIAELFKLAGFEVLTAHEAKLKGCRDKIVLAFAAEHNLVLITHDKKLACRKFALIPNSAGVVLLPAKTTKKENWLSAIIEKTIFHFSQVILPSWPSLRNISVQYGRGGNGAIFYHDPKRPGEIFKIAKFNYFVPSF